jgi:hypothetical protein
MGVEFSRGIFIPFQFVALWFDCDVLRALQDGEEDVMESGILGNVGTTGTTIPDNFGDGSVLEVVVLLVVC